MLDPGDDGALRLRDRELPTEADEGFDYRPAPRRTSLERLRSFVRSYGWRAYALPLLAVVTVVSLIFIRSDGPDPLVATRAMPAGTASPRAAGPPTAAGNGQLKVDRSGAGAQNEALAADALPPGPAYTEHGTGTFRVVPGSGPVHGRGLVRHYTVEVENGVAGVDLSGFAARVDAVLADARSWTHAGDGVAVQRVTSGPVDFRVTLTSSFTVRQLCGYALHIETSCWAPDHDLRVTLNVARWVRGDAGYVGDLDAYRTYMVDHETGHALGHSHAHACLPGGLAPVMMQQTITLKASDGRMCQANPWPYPPGVAGAPGVEQPGS